MFKNIRLVVLDHPISTWNDPTTVDLFSKIVRLKREGYGVEYPEGVLPLDATDFFGTHLLICHEKHDGELIPLVGYKSASLRRCNHYRTTFPALTILRNSGADDRKLVELVKQSENSGRDLSYDSSWTMAPDARKDREFSKLARDLLATMSVNYHREFDIPAWTVVGILRFKTDEYFRWMGHSDIVEPFAYHALYGEKATMLHLPQHSEECIKAAQFHQSLWDRRIQIQPSAEQLPQELAIERKISKAA